MHRNHPQFQFPLRRQLPETTVVGTTVARNNPRPGTRLIDDSLRGHNHHFAPSGPAEGHTSKILPDRAPTAAHASDPSNHPIGSFTRL
jgi:hypothetical protein